MMENYLQMIATTTPNRATPSTRAAAISMVVVIFPIASGWRAMASIACPPIWPMPMPAPTTARPAPTAAILPVIFCLFFIYVELIFRLMSGSCQLVFLCMCTVFVHISNSRANKNRGQHGEDVSLQHSHEHFKHVDE